MNWKARIRNKAFWVSLFSLFALVGRTFGIFKVPESYEMVMDAVLSLLVALGVIIDPTTPGIFDENKPER